MVPAIFPLLIKLELAVTILYDEQVWTVKQDQKTSSPAIAGR